jgi:hypothetical protein
MRFHFAFLSLLIAGCSQVDMGGAPEGGTGTDSFQSQMTGKWDGLMTNKTVDSGSALRKQTVNAEFSFTTETEGKFVFTLSKLEDARAEGTFIDFAGKSLHLNVTSSTVSTIGTAGTSTSMDYNMIGSNLELFNDRVEFQLIRGKDPTPVDPTNSGKSDPEGFPGHWTCNDGIGNVWHISIRDNTGFSADIEAADGSSSTIWVDGSLTISPKDTSLAAGKITSSRDAGNIGMRLTFSLMGDNSMVVDRYKSRDESDTTVIDSFQCTRS